MPFVPGLQLCQAFFAEAVRPLIEKAFPGLRYAAARLGPGSDVLDVWRYLLACQWIRIGEEEAFVGRAAEAGDELGSRMVAARLVLGAVDQYADSTPALCQPPLARALMTAIWRERASSTG